MTRLERHEAKMAFKKRRNQRFGSGFLVVHRQEGIHTVPLEQRMQWFPSETMPKMNKIERELVRAAGQRAPRGTWTRYVQAQS